MKFSFRNDPHKLRLSKFIGAIHANFYIHQIAISIFGVIKALPVDDTFYDNLDGIGPISSHRAIEASRSAD